jgi:uncharacterized protein (DUF488 family)
MNDLCTIGHSTHSIEQFLPLLVKNGITALADVRSAPYSRFAPQFNREPLAASLRTAGVSYVFVGRELGARSEDPACYREGRIDFARLAATQLFRQGLDRVCKGLATHRIALLCAEKDPITCHRMVLVCRHLQTRVDKIAHILEDGSTEEHAHAEQRLRQAMHVPDSDLFATEQELIGRAYDLQSARIAYSPPENGGDEAQ